MEKLKTVYDVFPVKVFLLWLVALLCGLVVAKFAFHIPINLLIAKLYEWDGGWYLKIIQNGYPTLAGSEPTIEDGALAFFPLYPLLVGIASFILHVPPQFVGIILSWLFFFVALQVLYYVLRRNWNFDQGTAKFALTLLALNPFAFFFGMLYTESLFLMLMAFVLLFLSEKAYLWAALFAGLASGTRNVGIFLGIMVVLGYMLDSGTLLSKFKEYKTYVIGLVSISGVAAFMGYLYVHTGNALAFMTVQKLFGRSFALGGFARDFGIIFEKFGTFAIWPYSLLAGMILCVLGIAAGVWLLRQGSMMRVYGIASILTTLAPLTSGTFASMNRYQMIHLGIYLFIGHMVRSMIVRYILLIGSVLLFIGLTILLCHPLRPLIG